MIGYSATFQIILRSFVRFQKEASIVQKARAMQPRHDTHMDPLRKEGLARHELLRDDADHADHGQAAVVQLLCPHLNEGIIVIWTQTEWEWT